MGEPPGVNECKPIREDTWYLAFLYCHAQGKRLPTEAEWEYAAAGGNEERTYAWGSASPTCTLANYSGCGGLTDVGMHPTGVGRWGHHDLSGSMFERILDFAGTFPNPCVDCANLSEGAWQVKGGSYYFWDSAYLPVAFGYAEYASIGFEPHPMGIRCARSL